MKNNINNIFGNKDLFPNKLIKNDAQPERYIFFDDEYAKGKNRWIAKSTARSRFYEEAVLAKIVFDYKKHHNEIYCLNGFFFNTEDRELEFYDTFVYANITLKIAKHIGRLRKQNKLTNIFGDIDNLYLYYLESNAVLRNRFKDFKDKPDYLVCLHPYIRQVLTTNDAELPRIMDGKDYKRSESDFIRTANSSRKKINDFLIDKFVRNKKIFISRFDVILRGDENSCVIEKYSLQKYRQQVGLFFEILGQFEYAVDVIFPTVLLTGKIIPSYSPVGQVVLVSTDRVGANMKALKEFAGQEKRCELLDFKPARPFPKGLVPCVDGVMEFTPSTVEGINQLAEFLTIERRFVAPLQGGADGSGTSHCMRFVELKR
ncbi:hypothetical protein [Comamonas sp. UBA7528]|uniref:hypothetical protein n=1 Tax=Comamonas sp. UBA7528 TaxID=1946391 RepID=UPI0025C19804|nr:hypothetical protein [Comamonas sp. UBA7528]